MGDGAVAGKKGSGTGASTGSGDGGSGSVLLLGQLVMQGKSLLVSIGGHPSTMRL